MKYFCFRFDVDTHRCLDRGVPNLIKLGKELEVPFTFFVNMGRAVSRMNYFRKIFKKNSVGVAKLSNLDKLGLRDFFIASILNPKVGNNSKVIKLAYEKYINYRCNWVCW